MNPDRWKKIEEIFMTAVDRPAAEREEYLTQVCGDDDDLRQEVLSLLGHEVADTFLNEPIMKAAISLEGEKNDAMLGRRVGPYVLTCLIGKGGMGSVYEARRSDDQFEQKVAIKVIKRGMDSEFLRERFLRERQILASLEHTNIARLLDGGATHDDGTPFFIMEYVTGEPITEYCRREELSVKEKLILFRRVCSAVQHAHQKLVVHRDLKPSNILVTADGVPKLLDFGIAKLLAPEPGTYVTKTDAGVRLMTPDYASPEQVRGLSVTTATDIYSLGVILYEVLTGTRPYEIKSMSHAEIERAVCDTETTKPSEAVVRNDGSRKLARRLEGDLDNIVMHALKKEPERRYQSVEQFSEDIRRHIVGHPVLARPDTLGYRAGKFISRHKTVVTATALVILSLIAGLVAVDYQARRAERRFQQVRKLSNTFLFEFHDKIVGLPGSTQAREMVVKTALEYLESLSQEASGDPELELELAEAYLKVGDVQGDFIAENLGKPQDAIRSYEKGLMLATKLANSDLDEIKYQRLLAKGYFRLGLHQSEVGDKITAHNILRRAVEAAEKVAGQNSESNDLVLLQNTLIRLGDTQLDTGDPLSALRSYRRSLAVSEKRILNENPEEKALSSLAMDYSHVGEALVVSGDLNGAIENYKLSLKHAEDLLSRSSADARYQRIVMIAYIWLGFFSGSPRHPNLGKTEEALDYFRKGLAIAEERVASDRNNARAKLDLAGGHYNVGEMLVLIDPKSSFGHLQQSLKIIREILKSSPDELSFQRREARYLAGLAEAQRATGDYISAIKNLNKALGIMNTSLEKFPSNTQIQADAHSMFISQADLLLETGDYKGALDHYTKALKMTETAAEKGPNDFYAQWRLATSYSGLGRYYNVLGSDKNSIKTDRVTNLTEAKAWHWKALELWKDWEKRGVSNVFSNAKRAEASAQLTTCNTALSKLTGTSD